MSASTERTTLRSPREWTEGEYFDEKPGFFQGREPGAVAAVDAREVVGKYADAIKKALQTDDVAADT